MDNSFLTSTESNKVGFNSTNGYESSYASAKGLQTGCRIHHLDDPSSYEVSAMYYNEYGEMIQRRSTNIMGGNDDDYIQYNHLTGKELTHKHIHSSFPQTSHTEIYTYTYDTADQLTSVKHKFDDNAQVTLYSLEYDNVGRVSSKALMNNAETVSYCYNIRDWLTGLSSTNYSESLSYYNSPNQSFNGNISRFMWHLTSSSATRGYDFVYDNLDRLTSATYGESESLQTNRNRYSTSYTYDKNGNILTLTRKGLQDGGSYGLIDNLTFIYAGNQVTRIDDSVNDPTYNGAFNFVDGASQSNEYTYDPNGNMTKDLNKNILSIQYNLLNLPRCMRLGNGNSAEYAYNAAGERLSTTYGDLTSGVTFYHSANYFYTYGPLYIFIDGGYITLNGSTPVYHYYVKDHLGSNRVVCNASGAVEQVNHYYPFGGLFGESTNASTQKYKYNGKELERVHGLDWYNYGARFMSPDVGRFITMDPMAEKYYSTSPYAYCDNNPINAIDPDGMDWYKDKDGTYQFRPEVHSQQDLDKGQTYLWKSNNISSKGINYRSDGSILYNNETVAYNRMWNQADKHYRQKNKGGREVGGFILSNGKVLVLPDYKNDATTSHISEYGYRLSKDGTLSHGEEAFKVLANIHTHQDKSADATPSYIPLNESDLGVSKSMGGQPVMTIGHDNKVHAIYYNGGKRSDFDLKSRTGLLNGSYKIFPWLKKQNFK